ncbi:MAG: hypothetical protein K8S18_05415 [Desulfobacula sp.]|nr:hypothetical protein [Desulfobacula sp.]
MMTKNRLIFFIVILLGFVNILVAQSQIKDSTDAYNYWAQRGIIEILYAYMNDYVETVGEAKAKNEIVGRDKYKEKFILEIENKELASFETISTFLKSNNWKGAEKKLFQPLVKIFKDSVKLNEHFFFSLTRNISKDNKTPNLVPIDYIPGKNGDKNKRTYWKAKGKEIVTNYNNELSDISEKHQSIERIEQEQITPPIEIVPEESEPNSQSNWMQWIIYLSVFILGILLGGWLVYILLKRRIIVILDSVDEQKKKLEDKKKEPKNNDTVKSLKNETEKLKRKNSELKQKTTQSQNDTLKPEIKPETENTHEWEIKQPEKVTLKLFFSMPESDDRFIVNNGESSNDGRKYYRIEYIEGSEMGELFYITGDRDKRAINRLESYLKPACDIENIINADSATNIEFIKPGKVILINDSWVIDSDNKAKIKLL